jgi:hypothetical protein
MFDRLLSFWRWTYAVNYLRCERQWRGLIEPHLHAVVAVSAPLAIQVMTLVVVGLAVDIDLRQLLEHAPGSVGIAFLILQLLIGRLAHVRFVKRRDANELIERLRHRTRSAVRKDELTDLCISIFFILLPFVLAFFLLWK